MALLKKTWPKLAFLSLTLLVLYLGSRLTNLTKLPIFTDEAIYIRWSQIGARDANWRFISLVDGKQPLFTWVAMAVLKVIKDPLTAGRLVSVGAGAASLVGIWFLAYELFRSQRVGFLASLLYLLSPFSLMYDRMALYDSMVATFSIWNLYLAILLVRRLRLDLALILGMTLGLGMLNKTSGFLSLYFLPLTLVLFDWPVRLSLDFARDRRSGQGWERLLKWLGLVVIAAIISQALYGVLRLSPLFHMIVEKDAVFIYAFGEWLTHPFRFVEGNLRGEFDWLWHYLTVPIFIASLLPMVFVQPKMREKLLLYAWWLAPFVALASFGRVLYPRFILFMAMPLLVLSAVTVDQIIAKFGKSILGLFLLFVAFFPSLYADYFIITNPIYAPIPFADKGQYIDDWPSGWGIREVNSYLGEQAQKGRVSIYTEGTFGLLPYAIEMYLVDNPNVKITGLYPLSSDIPQQILAEARFRQVYLVLNQTQIPPKGWPLELIAEYQKGGNRQSLLHLFRVVASTATKI